MHTHNVDVFMNDYANRNTKCAPLDMGLHSYDFKNLMKSG